VEHDLNGRKIITYKLMQHFNNTVKDTAKIDIIKVDQQIKHYKDLWCNPIEVQVQDVSTDKVL
jgi:hypothetical protein